jgi:hypothetical protein
MGQISFWSIVIIIIYWGAHTNKNTDTVIDASKEADLERRESQVYVDISSSESRAKSECKDS